MDYATLSALRPSSLSSTATSYIDLGTRFGAQCDNWEAAVVARTRANWQGGAAEQALPQLQQTRSRLAAGADNLHAIGYTLTEGAEQLEQCQAQLQQWEQQASQWGYTVGADGSLTLAPTPTPPTDSEQQRQAKAGADLMVAQAAIIAQASAVDAQNASAIQALASAAQTTVGTGQTGSPGGGTGGAPVSGGPVGAGGALAGGRAGLSGSRRAIE
ncbi:hypothetical protein OG455_15355 [Kitasatospora sp. NBC_01287]|uniref:hypothetical protein n=1 Tax=Kitasatospora sp. NBC_01287 TaxID=2903573 RepID=UPI00225A03F9|nr:hypothetical protein [Kitasatospora sp. NBC_01287]MCX4746882.1 hypothetical protein [Kitasatospora sp. NBC_01287]